MSGEISLRHWCNADRTVSYLTGFLVKAQVQPTFSDPASKYLDVCCACPTAIYPCVRLSKFVRSIHLRIS